MMEVIAPMDFTSLSMIDDDVIKISPMKEYYQGKCVFVTGATGFIGQLLVEKLLRSGVKSVYVLARPKKNVETKERISRTFSGPPFIKLNKMDPNFLDRVHVIEGSLNQLRLGINEQEEQILIDNVEIVIHAAADVRFDETLMNLFLSNLRGTREILDLAIKMKKLIVFTYISTAYSQCPRQSIDETFYEAPMDPRQAIQLAERTQSENSKFLEILTAKIIDPWPNTYTYTKAITEVLVKEYQQHYPIAIVRPSIIISTHDDPLPGWTNNIYGLTGLFTAGGYGFLRTLPHHKELIGDIICADYVVNSTLGATWHISNHGHKYDEPRIFNVTSSTDNPLKQSDIFNKMVRHFHDQPPKSVLRYPVLLTSNWQLVFDYYITVYHVIPFILIDIIFSILGKRIRLLTIFRKVYRFMAANSYFLSREWYFSNNVMKEVYDEMTEEDHKFYPSDVRNFDWDEYTISYYRGMKVYISREPIETAPYIFWKLNVLKGIYYIYVCCVYSVWAFLAYKVLGLCGLSGHVDELVSLIITSVKELGHRL